MVQYLKEVYLPPINAINAFRLLTAGGGRIQNKNLKESFILDPLILSAYIMMLCLLKTCLFLKTQIFTWKMLFQQLFLKNLL